MNILLHGGKMNIVSGSVIMQRDISVDFEEEENNTDSEQFKNKRKAENEKSKKEL
jgi:hypothetical protein